jgi:hypothetical protein
MAVSFDSGRLAATGTAVPVIEGALQSTGGNGGMGRAIALGLARAGSAVAVLGRNAEKNATVLAELRALNVPALALKVISSTVRDWSRRNRSVCRSRTLLEKDNGHALTCAVLSAVTFTAPPNRTGLGSQASDAHSLDQS